MLWGPPARRLCGSQNATISVMIPSISAITGPRPIP
jgi:hypothetical protein